jgi:hypothetical protein
LLAFINKNCLFPNLSITNQRPKGSHNMTKRSMTTRSMTTHSMTTHSMTTRSQAIVKPTASLRDKYPPRKTEFDILGNKIPMKSFKECNISITQAWGYVDTIHELIYLGDIVTNDEKFDTESHDDMFSVKSYWSDMETDLHGPAWLGAGLVTPEWLDMAASSPYKLSRLEQDAINRLIEDFA